MDDNEQDITIECKKKGPHCEGSFIWTLRDQGFYREKGYGAPKNCRPCRIIIKSEIQERASGERANKIADASGEESY